MKAKKMFMRSASPIREIPCKARFYQYKDPSNQFWLRPPLSPAVKKRPPRPPRQTRLCNSSASPRHLPVPQQYRNPFKSRL